MIYQENINLFQMADLLLNFHSVDFYKNCQKFNYLHIIFFCLLLHYKKNLLLYDCYYRFNFCYSVTFIFLFSYFAFKFYLKVIETLLIYEIKI